MGLRVPSSNAFSQTEDVGCAYLGCDADVGVREDLPTPLAPPRHEDPPLSDRPSEPTRRPGRGLALWSPPDADPTGTPPALSVCGLASPSVGRRGGWKWEGSNEGRRRAR